MQLDVKKVALGSSSKKKSDGLQASSMIYSPPQLLDRETTITNNSSPGNNICSSILSPEKSKENGDALIQSKLG
jgi:hypothetical protein